MKRILLAGMLMLPSMAFATTNCKVVEYTDHYDASCVGDEKSVPVQSQPVAPTRAETMGPNNTSNAQSQPQVSNRPEVTAEPAAARADVQPSASADSSKDPIVHRHGRPPKSVMDAAREMRNRVIQQEMQK